MAERGCVAVTDAPGFLSALEAALSSSSEPLLSAWAVQVVGGWILLQAALERLLPAEVVEGVVLADGSRLRVSAHSKTVPARAYPDHF